MRIFVKRDLQNRPIKETYETNIPATVLFLKAHTWYIAQGGEEGKRRISMEKN